MVGRRSRYTRPGSPKIVGNVGINIGSTFFGSAVGWVALWFVVYKVFRCVELTCPAEVSSGDLALAVIAFFGVTGYLPYVSLLIVNKLAEAVSKASEALSKASDAAKSVDRE